MYGLGAIGSFGSAFVDQLSQNEKDAAQKLKNKQAQFEMQGLEALGNAFKPDQGPLPPMPGQPSMPAGPPPTAGMTPAPGPPMGGMPPAAPVVPGNAGPGPAGTPPAPPAPPAGGGAPPAAPPSPAAGGMPQLDLQTLIQRIQAKNPNLPPQAMAAALNAALPMLTVQGRQDLAKLQVQMHQEELGLSRRRVDETERHNRAIEGSGDIAMSPQAVLMAAEKYRATGQLPPGLRDRRGGNVTRDAIINKAAEMDEIEGVTGADRLKKQQEFKAEQTAITRFMSGPQGNTIRSLGVVVDHLSTMKELGEALKNNDLQVFNRVAQAWAQQTGSSAPTNFDTAKQIVGTEIIKALGVAGAGTQAERAEAANAFSRASSPDQLLGAITVAQKLLGGQLQGLKRQFVSSTRLKPERFDELVGPEAMKFLGSTTSGVKGDKGGAPGGDTLPDSARSSLKEGQETTFGNGQVWTLQGGQPVRVR